MRKKELIKQTKVFNKIVTKTRIFFIRRKYKDELFRRLFSDKKHLLELYNALNGTEYTDESLLTMMTIEDTIYLGYKNDVSFLIGRVLNLYEHQSTFTYNMPLRGLLYFAKQYEGYVKQHGLNMYGKSQVKIPFPQYVVFYNGIEELPNGQDRMELKLSEAFEVPMTKENGAQTEIMPCLECTATVYNISYGHNKEVMEHCRLLEEYAIFIDKIAEYVAAGFSLKQAIDEAVTDCIEQGILREYLLKHRAEVVGMLLTEFNMKEFLEMQKRDGREEGRQEGREEEREQGIKTLIETCQELGISRDIIMNKISEKYNFDMQISREYLDKYWK